MVLILCWCECLPFLSLIFTHATTLGGPSLGQSDCTPPKPHVGSTLGSSLQLALWLVPHGRYLGKEVGGLDLGQDSQGLACYGTWLFIDLGST